MCVWKQSFMMNQQWFKGVLMITMMTTKDDDKGDEQKAQKIKEQLKWIKEHLKWIKNKSRVQESRRIQDSRRKSTIMNQDSRSQESRSRFKNEEKTQSR